MKIICAIVVLILVSGCATNDMRAQMEQDAGAVPSIQFSNARTVEEIRKLKPQATFPLRIAVMPPSRWNGLSQPEREVIEQWATSLQEMGFAETLQIVPRSLMPQCGYQAEHDCYLTQARVAGARLGADAILFLNDTTATDSYLNPLSILNLTIVGMWIVPAHHRDSYSIYEASLFDINNGYLYAVAEGYGEQKSLRPYVYAEYQTGQNEARLKALHSVGVKLLDLAKRQMNRAPGAAE